MRRLTVADVRYLLDCLPLDDRLRAALERLPVPLMDHLSEEDVDWLRDLCGERLQTVGFGPNYEPTDEGRLLETLVDKLLIDTADEE